MTAYRSRSFAILLLVGLLCALPVCGGGGSGGKKNNTTPPFLKVSGFARFFDVNKNATCDAGDTIIVPFNRDVAVNNADEDDFRLPVSGDSLGTGATVAAGPDSYEVTITLGTGPFVVKSRQDYRGTTRSANNPSGIDVAATMGLNAIETVVAGKDAEPSTPIDIVPGFVNSAQSLGNLLTIDVDLADLDNDGDLDLIDTSWAEANEVWFNNGSGTFTNSGQFLSGADSREIALGDLDGDGDIDIFEGRAKTVVGPNYVLLNNGAGTFVDSGQSLGNSYTVCVALGDLDGDGDLDCLAGNYDEANMIWLNDGSGTFTDSGQSIGLTETFDIRLGDVDGDGDLDCVEMVYEDGFPEPNIVWINNGEGDFSNSGQEMGGTESTSCVLGDVDNDGDLDIVEGNYDMTLPSGAPNRVWLGSLCGTWGSANFTDSGQTLSNEKTRDLALGDVDGDGDLDMLSAIWEVPDVVWINSGNGQFAAMSQQVGVAYATSAAFGDLDSDGDLDFFVGGGGSSSNVSYFNDGSGNFTIGQSLGQYDTRTIVLGDAEGDGDLDLWCGNDGSWSNLFFNDGSGSFTFVGAIDITSVRSLVMGDVDGDGDIDLLAGRDGQPNKIYANNGVGGFHDSGQSLGGTAATLSLALGDVDSDGDLDYVEGNGSSQANRVWLNNGAGTFSDSGQTLGSSITYRVALADIDGDGDLDIVAGNQAGAANKVWLNDGSGTFTDSGASIGSGNTYSIAVGDIDGDGDLDHVSANYSQANKVWRND